MRQSFRGSCVFAILLSLAGCSSQIMLLKTSTPETAEYRLVYGHRLVDYDHPDRPAADQLNEILQRDENTQACTIVPGSISHGEPGSTGTAAVVCENPIKVTAENSYGGSPRQYYYLLQKHSGARPEFTKRLPRAPSPTQDTSRSTKSAG